MEKEREGLLLSDQCEGTALTSSQGRQPESFLHITREHQLYTQHCLQHLLSLFPVCACVCVCVCVCGRPPSSPQCLAHTGFLPGWALPPSNCCRPSLAQRQPLPPPPRRPEGEDSGAGLPTAIKETHGHNAFSVPAKYSAVFLSSLLFSS